jgi:hypothetical protein
MKRIISILMIIAMMLSSVLATIPVGAEDAVEGGDSVVEDTTPVGTPVATADEFKAAVEAGKDFHLTADITLPADWAAKDFGATFDGNGKTITVLGGAGVFNTLAGATVKNLTIAGDVEASAGLATTATGNVLVENVSVKLTKIVGGGDGAAAFIVHCWTPDANLEFKGCTNYTPIVSSGSAAGFVSGTNCNTIKFTDCKNLATVSGARVGGFLGHAWVDVTFTNCQNGAEDVKLAFDGNLHTGGRIVMAENLRFPGVGSSSQGKPGAKARPKGGVDAHTVEIPEPRKFKHTDTLERWNAGVGCPGRKGLKHRREGQWRGGEKRWEGKRKRP